MRNFGLALLLLVAAPGFALGGIKRRLEEATAVEATDDEGRHRQGGLKARIFSEEPTEDTEPTPLFEELKRQWATGEMSARKVQTIAMKATDSGAQGVQILGRLGSHGDQASNIHRGLLNAFGIPKGSPDISWIELETMAGKDTPHPVLWPHLFFESFFQRPAEQIQSMCTWPPRSF